MNFFNNSIDSSSGTGTVLQLENNNGVAGGTNFVNISGNSLVGQGANGILSTAIGGVTIVESVMNISNNNISVPNGDNAINLAFEGQAIGEVSIANNTIDSDTIGIHLSAVFSPASSLNTSIINNNVSCVTGECLALSIDAQGTGQFDVSGNTLNITTPSAGAAATIDNQSTGSVCLSFNGNTANFVTPPAFLFRNLSSGTFFLTPPMNNTGNISETGTITQVNTLPCGL